MEVFFLCRTLQSHGQMDEEEWEELDENAMEECMVLATQLCSQQPQYQAAPGGQNSTHTLKVPQRKNYPETEDRKLPVLVSNGCLNNVRDSGVCSTRSTSLHPSISNPSNNTLNQKKDVSSSSYMSRFSDFSSKSTNLHHNTSTRKPPSGSGRGSGFGVSATSPRSSPSKAKSPWPGGDAGGGSYHLLLKKAEEEKTKLDERILVMQGEVRLHT